MIGSGPEGAWVRLFSRLDLYDELVAAIVDRPGWADPSRSVLAFGVYNGHKGEAFVHGLDHDGYRARALSYEGGKIGFLGALRTHSVADLIEWAERVAGEPIPED